MELGVGQLHEQIREEFAARLADARIVQAAALRRRQIADAAGGLGPDRHIRPLLEVHAAHGIAVEQVRAAKCQAEVLHHHPRLLAALRFALVIAETDEPLLRRLVVGVLKKDGQQFQRVAVRARRAAGGVLHLVKLRPRPAGVDRELHRRALHLPLDGGGIEQHLVLGLALVFVRIGRTALTRHANRIHAVGREPQRPQQARRGDFAVHLAVLRAVLDLQLVVLADDAGELWRRAARRFVAVVALTNSFGANAPRPVGPVLRSIEATSVGVQTCARRIAASRALADTLNDELR